ARQLQLDVRALQQLLLPVRLADPLMDEHRAVTREIPQLRIGGGGMKLARNSPCSKSCAIHSQSRTSVFRPGTALMWWAFTRMTAHWPSRMLNTGFQKTPVLSRATGVTPSAVSQSARLNNAAVIVPNVRTSAVRRPRGP